MWERSGGVRLTLMFALALTGACKSNEQKAKDALAEGNAALRSEKLDEAEQAFDRALALDAKSAEARVGRARVLIKKDDPERAVADLSSCEQKVCVEVLEQVLSSWIEEGKRASLTPAKAARLVTALQQREGDKCGMFAALAHADTLSAAQTADRVVLREAVRQKMGSGPTEISDTDPLAPLLRSAAAAGRMAGGDVTCEAARDGERALLGRTLSMLRMQGSEPDPLAANQLGGRLSSAYWSNALDERFRKSEQVNAPATASSSALDSDAPSAAWPPHGPGCEAFKACCDEIGKTLSTAVVCPLQLQQHKTCDEARRQMGLLFVSSGGELPASCK